MKFYPVTLLKETGYRFLFFLLYQKQNWKKTEVMKSHYLQTTKFFYATS
jgi:hypothetical protein